MASVARTCGFEPEAVRDLEIATGEAVANAVEHGNEGRGFFTLRLHFDGAVLAIEVQDEGLGFESAARAKKPFRGWGISIMKSLVDDLTFHDGGTRVRMTKRLTPSA